MKVAVLTFHRNYNYGANLQAYALQHTLLKMGYDAELLNYYYKSSSISIFDFSNNLRWIFDVSLRRKAKKFHEFQKKFIKLSKKVFKNSLKEEAEKYDCVIVGSDQVWNYAITQMDSSFFLDFVPHEKRRSYAASFGISCIPKEAEAYYQEHLSGFQNYSVRERTGLQLVQKMIGEKAIVDLDPVALLEREEWEKLIPRKRESGYIFLYMASRQLIKFACALSEKTGKKIIHVGIKSFFHPSKNIGEMYADAGPEEFLSLLYYSDIVVTESFHGTIISLLFNKDFRVSIPQVVGSRIKDLLEDFSLTNHIIDSSSCIEKIETDWGRINELMTKKRKKSLMNLVSYLGN